MTRCFEPEEIGAVLDLPADSSARRHLDACPRCRNLALAYYQYVEGKDADSNGGSKLDPDLERRLAQAFGAGTGAQGMRMAGPPVNGSNGARVTRRAGPPWALWMSAAVALAALIFLMVSGDFLHLRGDGAAGRGAMRGEDPDTGLLVTRGSDGLTLTWQGARHADPTVVIFYAEDMQEIGRAEVSGDRYHVAAGDPLAASAYCRVLRVAGGDTVMRSALVAPRDGGS